VCQFLPWIWRYNYIKKNKVDFPSKFVFTFQGKKESHNSVKSDGGSSNETEEGGIPGVELVHWNWVHVGPILTITAFIVLSGLGKVGNEYNYHNLLAIKLHLTCHFQIGFHYAHFISSRIPESWLEYGKLEISKSNQKLLLAFFQPSDFSWNNYGGYCLQVNDKSNFLK